MQTQRSSPDSYYVLAGDVGGTHARLTPAVVHADGRIVLHDMQKLRTADFDSFRDLLTHFRSTQPFCISRGGGGVGGPGDTRARAQTNRGWMVEASDFSSLFDIPVDRCKLFNDSRF